MVGGVVRTFQKEIRYRCKMARSAGSKTIAWIFYHATTLKNLDTIGSDGKAPCERWRGVITWVDACPETEHGTECVRWRTKRKSISWMETGIFVHNYLGWNGCVVIETSWAIRWQLEAARRTNHEDIVSLPVWPWKSTSMGEL